MDVAAYSVMMYVDFAFLAAFLGFSSGSAPVVSYQYGAGNYAELKSVFRKSVTIIVICLYCDGDCFRDSKSSSFFCFCRI